MTKTITLDVVSMDFGTVAPSTPSGPLLCTITNTGTESVVIGASSFPTYFYGDWMGGTPSPSPTLSSKTITSGSTAQFVVVAFCATLGVKNGNFNLLSDAASSPDIVAMTVLIATVSISISPTTLGFGNIKAGKVTSYLSNLQPSRVTIVNSSGSTLNISSITIPDGLLMQYNSLGVCDTSLPAYALADGDTLLLYVLALPKEDGSLDTTFDIAHDGAGSPSTITVTGTAEGIEVSEVALNFRSVFLGKKSQPKELEIRNRCYDDITLNPTTIPDGFRASFDDIENDYEYVTLAEKLIGKGVDFGTPLNINSSETNYVIDSIFPIGTNGLIVNYYYNSSGSYEIYMRRYTYSNNILTFVDETLIASVSVISNYYWVINKLSDTALHISWTESDILTKTKVVYNLDKASVSSSAVINIATGSNVRVNPYLSHKSALNSETIVLLFVDYTGVSYPPMYMYTLKFVTNTLSVNASHIFTAAEKVGYDSSADHILINDPYYPLIFTPLVYSVVPITGPYSFRLYTLTDGAITSINYSGPVSGSKRGFTHSDMKGDQFIYSANSDVHNVYAMYAESSKSYCQKIGIVYDRTTYNLDSMITISYTNTLLNATTDTEAKSFTFNNSIFTSMYYNVTDGTITKNTYGLDDSSNIYSIDTNELYQLEKYFLIGSVSWFYPQSNIVQVAENIYALPYTIISAYQPNTFQCSFLLFELLSDDVLTVYVAFEPDERKTYTDNLNFTVKP